MTFVISLKTSFGFQSKGILGLSIIAMNILGLCLAVQLGLGFGLAGLLWPDKFMPLFDVLMFPWAASYRMIRANSFGAIGVSLLLLARLIVGSR